MNGWVDTLATQPGEHSFALFVACCLVCANKANLYNDVSNDSRSCQFFFFPAITMT